MPSLKDYVKDGLKKGYSKNELTQTLLEKGYSKKEVESLFDEPKKEIVQEKTKDNIVDLNMFQKIGYLFSNPNKFFSSVRDTHIGYSIGMYIVAGILLGIVGLFFSLAFAGIGLNVFNSLIVFGGFGAVIFVFCFFFVFVYAAINHMFVKVFGGKGSYVDTFNALVYSAVPATLLTIVPLIGLLGIFYSIVLYVIGSSKYHEFSIGRAIGAFVCSAIISIIAIVLFIIWLLEGMF